MDSPIPEINTPVLKPVKATAVRKTKSLTAKLDKFADWIMAYVPPVVIKPANERLSALKTVIKDIYDGGVKKKATALKGYLASYQIKGVKTDPKTFMNKKTTAVLKLLREKEKPIKAKIILICEFYKKPKIYSFGYFHTKIEAITESSNLDEIYRKMVGVILEKFANYQNRGSGWIFKKIVSLEIHIDKYNPIAARSFIPLPKKLSLKKAVINPENKDNQCFKWAVTTAIFPAKRDLERITKVLRANAEKLNWQGLEFSVQTDKIDVFEENNPGYGINVFGYKGGEKEQVYPIRVSTVENVINLLMISDDSTNHYCWIKNMSRLLHSQINNHQHRRFFCDRCLCSFQKQSSLEKHSEYCRDHEAVKIKLPPKGTRLGFKNYNHSMRVPFIIYADFECFTHKLASCQPNDEESYTEKFQLHKPSGYCYMLKCFEDKLFKPRIVKYTATASDEDIGQKFVASLEETVRKLYLETRYKKVKMTGGDKENYKNAKTCHICEKELFSPTEGKDDKVLDHDHLTGRYRGAAHNACNINYKVPKHIPVVFHNLAGYDAHLFIKNLGVTEGKVDCIPNNEEKYISFKKEIIVDRFTDGKERLVKREIRFIDSFKFMASSLDRLVGNLKKDEFKNMKTQFPDSAFDGGEKLDMLLRKGVFPYDYFDSIEKLDDTSLPRKEEFYSKLYNRHISEDDYQHAQRVWETFGIRTLREYHDLYLTCDVVLLADVFETFRDVCLKNYKLDPAWYYTAPGLSWDAMLKKTKVSLELLSDPDMLLMIERGIRGGISMISKRYSKANNKYMKDYDPTKESAYIKYLDANNLYGWAMSQPMPTHGFKWMHKEEIKYWRKHPCILEVDIEYPKELHELHNEYPLAPERLFLENKVEKLVPNLMDKKKYVVHHQILKLYESLGLRITKVHRGIVFKESNWLGEYISLNTNLRTAAKNDFEKDFFKLMNNSVFGKTMENIRNRQDIRLATNEAQVKRLVSKPNYKSRTIFSENLVAVHMGKTELNFNKPIYIGMSILDTSKLLMYDFHYNYIKQKYSGNSVELLFTDTDSLMYEIKTEDFYEDIYGDLDSKFDTSAYGNHPVIDRKVNKKVIGMMKDETAGKEITEFVGLRSKLYSYRVDDSSVEEKKCKGIKKRW